MGTSCTQQYVSNTKIFDHSPLNSTHDMSYANYSYSKQIGKSRPNISPHVLVSYRSSPIAISSVYANYKKNQYRRYYDNIMRAQNHQRQITEPNQA